MTLTSVMYHYVRPIAKSRFPNLKGLELSGFVRQLDYLQSTYNIISPEHFLAHLINGERLPDRACTLTFDDGYRDHFDFVFPELMRRNLTGFFFPPACAIRDKSLLDVNAIHFILASSDDQTTLLRDLKTECMAAGMNPAQWDAYRNSVNVENRYDAPEITFVKRMLQRELPHQMRSSITKTLFEKYVGITPTDFCTELYVTSDELREMMANGMYVGNHTYNHVWLNSVSKNEQKQELELSQDYLSSLGVPSDNWVMCYPYGGYNADTLAILRTMGCVAGFTVKVGTANLATDDPLQINRFDTNDFPQ
ncbi:hypothetical protein GCM10008927_10480 [Amylibacter ulvae]|uniref:Chitooligosaccharide deacetylase n=1 Tax=Paramylibacter ulvae TaxID=1651968 RepID=A0ABQ3CZ35_9RHOB|nr:polysaccharide deacetylase family protein [Amylibacter ulvae]GHA47576.1 hypothetical protein GCM10008927_10480 [Amylibacter ulvae]